MRASSTLAILASLLISSAAPAGTILVDLNGGGDYLTIGEAIQAAVDGDSLLVAPGLYVGASNRAMDLGDRNLIVIGTAGPDSTIIDCEQMGRGFIIEGGQDSTCVMSGLTITRGSSFGGGAVSCVGSSPTFESCVFLGNRALGSTGGGGVRCDGGAPRFVDCLFADNTAALGGGILSKGASAPRLDNVTFEGNYGESTGGMRCESGSAALTDVTFTDNTSGSAGGALALLNGGPYSVSSSVFAGNVAEGGQGGAIRTNFSFVSVASCTFVDNGASQGSSIACSDMIDINISNTILAFGLSGRPLYASGCTPVTTHCCSFGNVGGNSLVGYQYDNIFVDPFFCGRLAGDLTLYDISECLPANNPWAVTIGAFGQGCTHPGPLPVPAGLAAVCRVDTVFVNWRAIGDTLLESYRLERDDTAAFGESSVRFVTSDTTVVDWPLGDGEDYFYRVFAVDEFGIESSSSETISCFVALIPPSSPTGVVAWVGDRVVDLAWAPNQEPDLVGYVVYRDTVPGFIPDESYAAALEPQFSDTAVANYASYYYRVAAVDSDSMVSDLSAEVRAVPHGRPPRVLGLAATPGDSSAIVTWLPVEPACAQHYVVFRDTTPEMVSPEGLREGFEQCEPGLPPPGPLWSVVQQAGTVVRATESQHAIGARSLAVRDSSSGYARLFAGTGESGSQAPRVRFRVRTGADSPETDLFQMELFGEDGIGYPAGVLEVCDGSLRHWVTGSDPETLGACEPELWHAIEWNLDCAADTYGVWLDGQRVAGGVPFFNDAAVVSTVQMRTRHLEWGEVWVDELLVGDHLESIDAVVDTAYADGPLMNGVTYYYKVAVVDTFGTVGEAIDVVSVVPGAVGIDGGVDDGALASEPTFGSPNPFRSETALAYTVPFPAADVVVRVYDPAGRVVRTVVEQRQDGGSYRAVWNGRDDAGRRVASGVYFCRVAVGDQYVIRKVVLLR